LDNVVSYEARRDAERANIRHSIIAYHRKLSMLAPSDLLRTFATFKPEGDRQRQAAEVLRADAGLWPGERRSFYLWGRDFGPGKSHLAKAYANALLDRGFTVLFWRGGEFTQAVHYSWDADDVQSPVVHSQEADLVVFDDIDKGGIHKESGGLWTALWRVVDYRSDEGKPIVITSQLPLKGQGTTLETVMGGSFVDRLAACRVIEVEGKSGRGKHNPAQAPDEKGGE